MCMLNKQGEYIQRWCTSFPILNQFVIPCLVLTVPSWPAYRFLRRQVKEIESESRSIVSDSLRPHGLYSPWNSPGQNTGVGSLSLLQRIFPTQGLNPGLLPCRWILYQLSHKGSPRILEWVAYPFSSRSSWPRNRTGVSCISGRFFTNWAIREAPKQVRWSGIPSSKNFPQFVVIHTKVLA